MDGTTKRPLVVIAGATATGKSGTAVDLALETGGEIVSGDSMQIYRGLDVGTAKTPEDERRGVPHHLLDIRDPQEPYSAADFVAAAGNAIDGILGRGHLPILCGGTGFYIDSLVHGMVFEENETDESVRRELRQAAAEEGLESLYEKLREADPVYAAKISPADEKRILRALEIIRASGITPTQRLAKMETAESRYDALYFVLLARDRENLYRKIEARIDGMIREGLLNEAENVWRHRETYLTAAQAIGYKEFFPYFEGRATPEECADELKKATRHFAKRQYSWFRRVPQAVYYYIDEMDRAQTVGDMVRRIREHFGSIPKTDI